MYISLEWFTGTLYILASTIHMARLGRTWFGRTVETNTVYILLEWFRQVHCIYWPALYIWPDSDNDFRLGRTWFVRTVETNTVYISLEWSRWVQCIYWPALCIWPNSGIRPFGHGWPVFCLVFCFYSYNVFNLVHRQGVDCSNNM